jgi:WD40 repeat protein
VRQNGPVPVAQACDFIRQAALGLQHAHEQGLVHRDVKPHNLLCARPEGRIKILDMGLARLLTPDDEQVSTTLTQEGMVMGTPDYIAPEQAMDAHNADIRADLYSLGCTFFFLLTGQPPFPGGSVLERLWKHQTQPPPLEALRPQTHPAVVAVIDRLLAKRPEARYQTPAELALDLEALLGGSQPELPVPEPTLPTLPPLTQPAADTSSPFGFQEDTDPGTEERRRRSLAQPIPWTRIAVIAVSVALVLVLLIALLRKRVFGTRPVEAPPEEPPITLSFVTEEDARKAWQLVRARLDDRHTGPQAVRAELLAFSREYPGTEPAQKAAARLMRLPSPLDALQPGAIDPALRVPHQPAQLVAVLGHHRGWRGYNPGPGFWPVHYSPDGKWLACTTSEGDVRLMDPSTLQARHTIHPLQPARTFAFHPGSRQLATVGGDVALWDLTGEPARALSVDGLPGPEEACFSPDGKSLAIVCNGAGPQVQLWDVTQKPARRTAILNGHRERIDSVAFAPDGKSLATGSHDRTVRLWDLTTNPPRQRSVLEGHKDWVYSVAFSPNGKWLASAGAHDWTVRVWSLRDNKEKAVLGIATAANCVAFSPDSTTLAAGTWNNTIILWTVTEEAVNERDSDLAHGDMVVSLDFSPDGKTLVSAGNEGTFRLWDIRNGKLEQRELGPGHELAVRSVAFSPEGSLLASTSDDETARIWSFEDGKLEERREIATDHPLLASQFSPDGSLLATGNEQGQVQIWQVADGKLRAGYAAHSYRVLGLDFRPDGKEIGSSGGGNLVQLHGVESGAARSSSVGGSTDQVQFSPTGRLLAVAGGGNLQLWSTQTLGPIRLLGSNTKKTTALGFSPDGKHLLVGDVEGKLRLWNASTGKEIMLLPGHDKEIVFAAFTPDGKQILSADRMGKILLRSADRFEQKPVIQLPGMIFSAALACDGRHLATANADGTVYILRIGEVPR